MAKANSSFSEVQIARRIKEGRGVEIPGILQTLCYSVKPSIV